MHDVIKVLEESVWLLLNRLSAYCVPQVLSSMELRMPAGSWCRAAPCARPLCPGLGENGVYA